MKNKIANYLVIGNVFSALAFFMCIPFLAIQLVKNTELSPLMAGTILGSGPLVSAVVGLMVGALSDFLGRKHVLVACIFLRVIVSLGFAFAEAPFEFLILNLLNGVTMAGFGPVSKAFISDLISSESRTRYFGYLYVGTNIGGALGPLIGASLYKIGQSLPFLAMAAISFIYGFCLLFLVKEDSTIKKNVKIFSRLTDSFKVVSTDIQLLKCVLAFSLISMAYAQLESTLPELLRLRFTGNEDFAISLYSYLLAANAIFVVLLQKITEKLTGKFGPVLIGSLGITLIALGLLFLAFASTSLALLFLGMFIFTLGEMFEYLSSTLVVDKMAPAAIKGTYFGAFTLRNFGRFIGPIFGVYLIRNYGSETAYSLLAFITFSAILFLLPNKKSLFVARVVRTKANNIL